MCLIYTKGNLDIIVSCKTEIEREVISCLLSSGLIKMTSEMEKGDLLLLWVEHEISLYKTQTETQRDAFVLVSYFRFLFDRYTKTGRDRKKAHSFVRTIKAGSHRESVQRMTNNQNKSHGKAALGQFKHAQMIQIVTFFLFSHDALTPPYKWAVPACLTVTSLFEFNTSGQFRKQRKLMLNDPAAAVVNRNQNRPCMPPVTKQTHLNLK